MNDNGNALRAQPRRCPSMDRPVPLGDAIFRLAPGAGGAVASPTLSAFLASAGTLTDAERERIVDQAIVLLEGFYVHLPLKRAMHAVDPLQRLRLLRKRLPAVGREARFHAEVVDIFTSVRDLHTGYQLPAPFADVVAYLPFRVERCRDDGRWIYIVGGVTADLRHPTFVPGVEVRYWNSAPIERAVENAAARHAGSNPDARLSRGLAGLTVRPLVVTPPPDEEWVIVGYRTPGGEDLEARFDWQVAGLPAPVAAGGETFATARGTDLETQLIQDARRVLFAPQAEANQSRLAAAADPLSLVKGSLESTMPRVFTARVVETPSGTFGHVRIWNFSADPEPFVAEFVRLAELLPQNGLILDVRDNGGGVIHAGEELLQVLTPRRIEPERVQFINTPQTRRLCDLHDATSAIDLSPWAESVRAAVETGATFSAAIPMTPPEACNAIGQRYRGPVVLVTSARCYSTTDIFAAGFQDHGIGPVLGVDGRTGAGGANVWTHSLLQWLFSRGDPPIPIANSPLEPLPMGVEMRVAIRRTLRVGPRAGMELEDLGVVPDERHDLTRRDILDGNLDLMAKAGQLLAAMPVYDLSLVLVPAHNGGWQVTIGHIGGLARLDLYIDDRPTTSLLVDAGSPTVTFDLPWTGSVLRVEGHANDGLAVVRRCDL